MVYKHFYLIVSLKLLVVIILTAISTYLLFVDNYYIWWGAMIIPMLIVAVFNLIGYFNNINKWISFFLSGIENEDATLKVPTKSGNRAVDDVYNGIERIRELLKQAKIDISTQEYYYRSVINQSATGLFSVNENGRVVNINPAAIKLTGLQEYHHINILEIIDETLPDFIMHATGNKSQQSVVFENQFGQKLLFKLSEIQTSKEIIRLVAVGDITKELDNGEIDAWIKLARTLSHEIMNNIAPITTLSKVISDYFTIKDSPINSSDIEQKTISNTLKGLQVIEERSVGLMNFVENYRKFTKLPSPQLMEYNLSEIVENNIVAAAAYMQDTEIHTEKEVPETMMVYTDKELLSQVIINLLKNACEALILGNVEDPVLVIKLTHIINEVKIDVSNNGPQIPNEIREQIFIPFYTTKEEGSGIGLSLSKQIMLKMGGDIKLKSGKEDLTTFSIIMNVNH